MPFLKVDFHLSHATNPCVSRIAIVETDCDGIILGIRSWLDGTSGTPTEPTVPAGYTRLLGPCPCSSGSGSSGGVTAEDVQDLAAALFAGLGTYNDAAGTFALTPMRLEGYDVAGTSLGADQVQAVKLRAGAGMQLTRGAAGDLTIVNTRGMQAASASLAAATANTTLSASGQALSTINASGTAAVGMTLTDPATITMLNPTANPTANFAIANTFGLGLTGVHCIGGHILWLNGTAMNSSTQVSVTPQAACGVSNAGLAQTLQCVSSVTADLTAGTSAVWQVTRAAVALDVTGIAAPGTATNTGRAGQSSFNAIMGAKP